jgi:hypothetical protein
VNELSALANNSRGAFYMGRHVYLSQNHWYSHPYTITSILPSVCLWLVLFVIYIVIIINIIVIGANPHGYNYIIYYHVPCYFERFIRRPSLPAATTEAASTSYYGGNKTLTERRHLVWSLTEREAPGRPPRGRIRERSTRATSQGKNKRERSTRATSQGKNKRWDRRGCSYSKWDRAGKRTP